MNTADPPLSLGQPGQAARAGAEPAAQPVHPAGSALLQEPALSQRARAAPTSANGSWHRELSRIPHRQHRERRKPEHDRFMPLC